MAGSKFNLPSSLRSGASGTDKASEALQIERLRTEKAGLDAYAKVESARLGVATQTLEVVKKGLEVVESYHRLQTTKAEWQGRIEVAELELKKVGAELVAPQEKNAPIREQLEQTGRIQQRVLKLFDTLMAQAEDPAISMEDKQNLTTKLLDLTKNLVSLKA